MGELFPIYRSLAGPGFLESLGCIGNRTPMAITEIPSGTRVFDWVVPKEFRVHSSYVVDPNGERILDFDTCSYHTFLYSQPFHGRMSREALIENVETHHLLPDAIPLRMTYYRDKWGLCASAEQVASLPEGDYDVHVDTELVDGVLRIGETYLEGESDLEIMISSYLCHPLGANDNLSGVVVAIELFRLLSQLPKRRYSYRLVLWPETIGAISYIWRHPERLKRTIGGYVLTCLGDDEGEVFNYRPSGKNGLVDRAMLHALKVSGFPHHIRGDSLMQSDERQFNCAGVNIPFGILTRSLPAQFKTYHSSKDDMNYVKPEVLYKSLKVYWNAIMAIERCATYRGTYTVEPFLTGYGIYPFDLGAGEGNTHSGGEEATQRAHAFFHLIWNTDGTRDLLEIADMAKIDVSYFDRPVSELLGAGLIEETAGPSHSGSDGG